MWVVRQPLFFLITIICKEVFSFLFASKPQNIVTPTIEIWSLFTNTTKSYQISTSVPSIDFLEGDTLTLTCRKNEDKSWTFLQWEDNNGIKLDGETETIRLKLILGRDDQNLSISCHCRKSDAVNQITNTVQIRTQIYDSVKDKHNKIDNVVYIREGSSLNLNNTCNGVVHSPGNYKNTTLVYPGETIFKNFRKFHNGTIVDCIIYYEVSKTNKFKTWKQWDRVREKTMYILNETKIRIDELVESTVKTDKLDMSITSPVILVTTATPATPTRTPWTTIIVVIAIILFLTITLIILLWYRKNRLNSCREATVVYAEILHTASSEDPLPQRQEMPYARIIGVMAPREQIDASKSENLYCSVK